MYYNLFDSHTHSENSPDGSHSVSFMAETAIKRGLQGICLTDYCAADCFDESRVKTRIKQSALDTAMARAAFGRTLVMTFGVEIGQAFYNLEAIEDMLANVRFDFVIASLHRLVFDGFDFFHADYGEMPAEQQNSYMLKYFEELLELIRWGGFDVLGHLSYPLCPARELGNIHIDLARYKEPIDEVLRRTVAAGKGIEINTSGLRGALDDTLPPAWIIKRFKEVGGEIVTIGSDAHCAEELGDGVERGMRMLADAGFEYFAFYRSREPVMLRII